MLPNNPKEESLEEHLQEVEAHLDNNLPSKDPLPEGIRIKDMKGNIKGRNQDKILIVNPKEDMRIDKDPNTHKEKWIMGEGNHKEGNIKSAKIEERDIRHNKEGNIKSARIEEEDIHRNKEGTLKLNIEGIHKVSTIRNEGHKRSHPGVMQNPVKEDLKRGLEKRVEAIFAQIAEGKFTVIRTAAFCVDGTRKQRVEELHLTSPEEMIIPRGRDIKENHKEEVLLRGGKDKGKIEYEEELPLPGKRKKPGMPRNPRE